MATPGQGFRMLELLMKRQRIARRLARQCGYSEIFMKTILLFPTAVTLQGATAVPFSLVEATIPDMRAAMEKKQVTSRELVIQYLTRIAMYENQLHAIITVNSHAIQEA